MQKKKSNLFKQIKFTTAITLMISMILITFAPANEASASEKMIYWVGPDRFASSVSYEESRTKQQYSARVYPDDTFQACLYNYEGAFDFEYTYTASLKCSNSKITWSTSNKNIATVNSKGKVTAKKVGNCNIKAKYAGKVYQMPLKVVNRYKSSKYTGNYTLPTTKVVIPTLSSVNKGGTDMSTKSWFGNGEHAKNQEEADAMEKQQEIFERALTIFNSTLNTQGYDVFLDNDWGESLVLGGHSGDIAFGEYNSYITLRKDVTLGAYTLSFNHTYGASWWTGIRLKDGYFVRDNLQYEDPAPINRDIVQFMLAMIVPGDELKQTFDAIYDSWEGDEKLGINAKTWTRVGSVDIKYDRVTFEHKYNRVTTISRYIIKPV